MNPTTINTPEARMSYMKLYHPVKNLNDKEIYQVTLLIPKETDISTIQAAINQVIENESNKKFRGVPGAAIQSCLKDGDIYYQQKPEKREAYIGHWYINCSKDPQYGAPTVLDENGMPTDDPAVFDSGDYGIARIQFWGYNTKGNQGVSCTIFGVKKTRTGEKLGGGESRDETMAALGGLASTATESIDEDSLI
ncbi:MAG: DUF2815 family protein [Desulfobacteraceae bacterium]|jgi:hypothetical protein